MIYRINVTDDDIARGKVADNESCPIAIAVKRAFPTRHVQVGDDAITLDLWENYPLPEAASAFVAAFDRPLVHAKPGPFSFEFDDAESAEIPRDSDDEDDWDYGGPDDTDRFDY